MKRIGFISTAGDLFISPVMKDLGARYEISDLLERRDNSIGIKWPASVDLLWIEWANEAAIEISRQPKTCPIVVRLHSYEVFAGFPEAIDWSKVDVLIFVAEHVRDYAIARYDISGPEIVVAPVGVDLERFEIPAGKTYGHKIAWVGTVSEKKGPMLFVQACKAIHDAEPRATFHVAGEVAADRFGVYLEHAISRLGLQEVICFEGKIANSAMPAWYADKDYVISSSPWEGVQCSVAEAVACGCIPLIHDWPGSQAVYDFPDASWLAVSELPELISKRNDLPGRAARNREKLQVIDQQKVLKILAAIVDRLLLHAARKGRPEGEGNASNSARSPSDSEPPSNRPSSQVTRRIGFVNPAGAEMDPSRAKLLSEHFELRSVVETEEGGGKRMRWPPEADVLWFEGVAQPLGGITQQPKLVPIVVCLDPPDVPECKTAGVNWSNVDLVTLSNQASLPEFEIAVEQAHSLETQVLAGMEDGVEESVRKETVAQLASRLEAIIAQHAESITAGSQGPSSGEARSAATGGHWSNSTGLIEPRVAPCRSERVARAISWVKAHTLTEGGIRNRDIKPMAYPEVTGYLIPTMLDAGEDQWALKAARWLMDVQLDDGSFPAPGGTTGFAFDTGQVLRGILRCLPVMHELEQPIRRACSWMVSTASDEGRLRVPVDASWSLGKRGRISEAIHLYALKPLIDAAVLLNDTSLSDFARRSAEYYIDAFDVTDFNQPNMLSHFFVYIQEALVELGRKDLAEEGMASIARHHPLAGGVPAYSNVPWICVPGQAQAACVWYLLGEKGRADQTLEHLELLQNPSGGFFGSVGPGAEYFATEEIPWAVKYYLDAYHLAQAAISRLSSGVAGNPEPGRARRLAVVPNDPLQAYEDAGYRDMTDYFNPQGLFDEVYCLSPWETVEIRRYGMTVLPTRPDQMVPRLRQLGIDLVRAYDVRAASLACDHRVEGVPVLVSVHDTNPARVPVPIPRADAYLAMSQAVEQMLIDRGVTKGKIFRLPNRVDLQTFRPLEDPEILGTWNRSYPGKYRIVHVGRKTEQKNLETLIGALGHLGPDYVAIFVGRGDEEPYRNLATEHGVLDRCVFGQAVPNAELAGYFSACDCMCTPSLWEGFGIVFIEAMACGAPVITSDIGPMNEYIEDGVNGLLVQDYEDPRALAEAIRRVCTDKELSDALKANAQKAVRPFSKEKVAQREVDIYRAFLGAEPVTRLRQPFARAEKPARTHGPNVLPLSPDLKAPWDEIALTSDDAWLFHHHAEQELLEAAWNAESHSFLVEDSERIVAIVPLQRHMGDPSVLDSTILGPAGPALSSDLDAEGRRRIMRFIILHLRSRLVGGLARTIRICLPPLSRTSLELSSRAESPLAALGLKDISTRTMILNLAGKQPSEIFRGFRKGHRSEIKRAEKAGVEISIASGMSDIREYYELHRQTYARTGAKTHPISYFEQIWERFGTRCMARFFMARLDGKAIAGTNIARVMDTTLYWTGAYSERALELGAGKLLQWEAICWALSEGVRWHELGEVFPDAPSGSKSAGLTRYKRGFGGQMWPFFKGLLTAMPGGR